MLLSKLAFNQLFYVSILLTQYDLKVFPRRPVKAKAPSGTWGCFAEPGSAPRVIFLIIKSLDVLCYSFKDDRPSQTAS